jgi:hypothetical protein
VTLTTAEHRSRAFPPKTQQILAEPTRSEPSRQLSTLCAASAQRLTYGEAAQGCRHRTSRRPIVDGHLRRDVQSAQTRAPFRTVPGSRGRPNAGVSNAGLSDQACMIAARRDGRRVGPGRVWPLLASTSRDCVVRRAPEGDCLPGCAPRGVAVASGGEVERRVAIGEQADVGLHAKRVAVGADEEVTDCLWVLPGEEHDEGSGDDPQAGRDE